MLWRICEPDKRESYLSGISIISTPHLMLNGQLNRREWKRWARQSGNLKAGDHLRNMGIDEPWEKQDTSVGYAFIWLRIRFNVGLLWHCNQGISWGAVQTPCQWSYLVLCAERPIEGLSLDLASGLRVRKCEEYGKQWKDSGFYLHCGRKEWWLSGIKTPCITHIHRAVVMSATWLHQLQCDFVKNG
jgi:hypothetical protein